VWEMEWGSRRDRGFPPHLLVHVVILGCRHNIPRHDHDNDHDVHFLETRPESGDGMSYIAMHDYVVSAMAQCGLAYSQVTSC
jgi:hypothetical protein